MKIFDMGIIIDLIISFYNQCLFKIKTEKWIISIRRNVLQSLQKSCIPYVNTTITKHSDWNRKKKYQYTIIQNIYAESQYKRTIEEYFFIHLYNVYKTGTFWAYKYSYFQLLSLILFRSKKYSYSYGYP